MTSRTLHASWQKGCRPLALLHPVVDPELVRALSAKMGASAWVTRGIGASWSARRSVRAMSVVQEPVGRLPVPPRGGPAPAGQLGLAGGRHRGPDRGRQVGPAPGVVAG